MTELIDISSLFFILPGFITFLLIKYIGFFTSKPSQVEFTFYSLACSMPSYLLTTLFKINIFEYQLVVQILIAICLGLGSGIVIKKQFRKNVKRYSPWHNFCWDNTGMYVIVYTNSSQRIYGWIRRFSTDDEPKREIVLGNPQRIKNDGTRITLGQEMLIAESEISKILLIGFKSNK